MAAHRNSPAFNQKVDQAFYDQARRENGGKLPPDLLDAQGNPRRLTMSAADSSYRQKWNATAAKLRSSQAVRHKTIKSVCVPCASKAEGARIPAIVLPSKNGGKPVKASTPQPAAPRKIATKTEPPIPCKLTDVDVTCAHAREPQNGVLCVVPDDYKSIGDRISCRGELDGGCGSHIEWSISGVWTDTERGSSTSFLAKTFKPALLDGWLGLHHVSPQTYQVQPTACEGDLPSTLIKAYPPDEWGGKIDFEEIQKKIKEWLGYAPVKEEELEPEYLVGSIGYVQQWKEDLKSNLAYCESKLTGSFDPLVGAKFGPKPLYPLSLVPVALAKLMAGIYFTLEGSFSIKVDLFWNYWPEKDQSEYEKSEVTMFGQITGTLSLNLFVIDKELIKSTVSGSTGMEADATLSMETEPALNFAVKWTGLEAEVAIEAVWGWIEFDRTYPLLNEKELIEVETSA